MNLNTTMKKLQRAILSTGLVIKIGTSQFYSPEQGRMITMWILSTLTLQNGRNGWRMRDLNPKQKTPENRINTAFSEKYFDYL